MTIGKKLSVGIGVLMTLFLSLGVISYFQIGQIDRSLSEIIRGKTLGQRALLLHQRYKDLRAALAKVKDARDVLFEEVTEALNRLEAAADDLPPAGPERTQALRGAHKQITKLAASLHLYVLTPNNEHEACVRRDAAAVERTLSQLKSLPPAGQQTGGLMVLQEHFTQALSLLEDFIAASGDVSDKSAELADTAGELDAMLAADLAVFTRTDLKRAEDTSRRMVQTKVAITFILVLTGLLDVFVFSAAIKRSITRPLISLKNATTAIGRGDFDAEIKIESADEIGQLAAAFKQMAQQRKQAEDKLRETRDQLEVRVKQRTAELVQANEILVSEIRERKKAEKGLEGLNGDLEASVRELIRSNLELQEFSYIAAHDLKTPLRGIATLAEWISTDYVDKLGEEGGRQVEMLLARTKQMDALVDGVLQYSSLHRCDQTKRQVDLNVALSEAIAEIEVPENVKIGVENELPVLICEKEHMKKVFLNLLNNAIEHGVKNDGQITIRCVELGNVWKFSVSDDGPGIDKKYFEKIFRIFQTLSPREQTGSTGIGLSIVKKIIELNSGDIWVESEPGKGSTFYFTLPLHMTALNSARPATGSAC